MTIWERIDKELAVRRMTWTALAVHLGLGRAATTNWKSKGVPAKHYHSIEQYLGKHPGWAQFGDDAPDRDIPKRPLTALAASLAELLDTIPESDVKNRSRIFAEVLRLVGEVDAQRQAKPASSESSRKLPS